MAADTTRSAPEVCTSSLAGLQTTRLTPAQNSAAHGKVFDAVGVIEDCSRVRFLGVFSSGSVGVQRESDPHSVGPITITAEQAEPLLAEICRCFHVTGWRIFPLSKREFETPSAPAFREGRQQAATAPDAAAQAQLELEAARYRRIATGLAYTIVMDQDKPNGACIIHAAVTDACYAEALGRSLDAAMVPHTGDRA